MSASDVTSAERERLLREIDDHLVKALEKLDRIDPDSIFGARVQHVIDDLRQGLGQGARDPSTATNTTDR